MAPEDWPGQCDLTPACKLLEESLAIHRTLENKQGIADCLHYLGFSSVLRGDYAAGRALFEESVAIKRELGDKAGIIDTLTQLVLSAACDDLDAARILGEETLTLARTFPNQQLLAGSLLHLGVVCYLQGQHRQASAFAEEGLTVAHELEDPWSLCRLFFLLGLVACAEGDYGASRRLHKECAAISQQLGNQWMAP